MLGEGWGERRSSNHLPAPPPEGVSAVGSACREKKKKRVKLSKKKNSSDYLHHLPAIYSYPPVRTWWTRVSGNGGDGRTRWSFPPLMILWLYEQTRHSPPQPHFSLEPPSVDRIKIHLKGTGFNKCGTDNALTWIIYIFFSLAIRKKQLPQCPQVATRERWHS